MAYEWCTWMADVLRAGGCQVEEHAGWETRGLSASKPFEPRAVVWHHDASPPGDSPSVPLWLIKNYSTASAQTWVDRYGVWHLIGAGRAPHAGVVLPGKPGNTTSIGVETDHTTGEDWPAAQLDALRRGTAAILLRLGTGAGALEFHATICSPPGRKVDPHGLDLAAERAAVDAILNPAAPPPPPPPPPVRHYTPRQPAPAYRQGGKVYSSKMHRGQTDSDSVWNLQRALIHAGESIPAGPTGNYLDQTVAACASFQRKDDHLDGDPDGIAGPQTVAHLGLVWVTG